MEEMLAMILKLQERIETLENTKPPRITTYGVRLPVVTTAPASPVNGDLAYADGAGWNPGAGAGVYAREGGAWVKL